MNEYKTKKTRGLAPYGLFDDIIKLRVVDTAGMYLMRAYEFDWLAEQVLDNSMKGKCRYIQIVKEWNECTGIEDIAGRPSIISDIQDTINALQIIMLDSNCEYNELVAPGKEDINALIDFFLRNSHEKIKISKR